MRVVVRTRAALQVQAIFKYIARDNPAAARRTADAIYDQVERIAQAGFGYMGRAGRKPDTREVTIYPYIIVYKVDPDRDEIVVLSVVHGARRR